MKTDTQPIDDYSINGVKPINSEDMATYSALEANNPTDNGIKRDTRFKAGNKLSNGRPKGSRSKLGETFLQDVHQLWLDHGNQALRDMLEESPTKFCQMVQACLPKTLELDTKDGITWVINAAPALSTEQWLEQHNLIEQDGAQDKPSESDT